MACEAAVLLNRLSQRFVTRRPEKPLSSRLTVEVAVAPAVTPAGSVPKPRTTLSPSSISASAVARIRNVLRVSSDSKTRPSGTPE